MTQYIDKSALVAEIERMKNEAYPNSEWNHGYVASCEKILSILDTLEVKEVDSTDAFIEKACEWLKDNYPYYFETDIEQEFIKAMKGE